jgi:uncharacterized membrane protein YfcA
VILSLKTIRTIGGEMTNYEDSSVPSQPCYNMDLGHCSIVWFTTIGSRTKIGYNHPAYYRHPERVTLSTFFLMTAFVIFIIGVSKGGLSGTVGVLATPLMALVMPADKVIGLLLPILIIADIFAVASHWQKWDNRLVLQLIPGGIAGIILGSFLISSISPLALKRGIGIVVLLFVIYKLFEQKLINTMAYQSRHWHGVLAGSAAGVSSTLAHTGGPPIVIYLLLQNISPRVFVATSALYFAILNLLKVPSYFFIGLFDFDMFRQIIWLLLLLPLSVWIGKIMAEKIDKVLFERIILVFLTISAFFLLFR